MRRFGQSAAAARAIAAGALGLLLGSPALAQTPFDIHANAVLPKPLPSAPIADWIATKGRVTTNLSAPGAILRGYVYAGADPKAPTLVFFLGNGTNLEQNDATLRALAALGPTVVSYDYRGFGFSVGIADIQNMENDAQRILAAAVQTAGTRGVVAYGFSLGTAMAASAAAQVPVAGVILGAPFASAAEQLPVSLALDHVPADIAARMSPAPDSVAAFANADFVGRIQAPLLILHGTADTSVPIAQGREVLAASTSQRKSIVELAGLDHVQILRAPEALAAIKAFVASVKQ